MFEYLDLKIDATKSTPATTVNPSEGYWCSNTTLVSPICHMVWTTVALFG